MKITARILILIAVTFLSTETVRPATAQPDTGLSAPVPGTASSSVETRSGKQAFLRSVLLPGLGHRYARGRWERSGVVFTATETLLWLNLFGGEFRRNYLVDSYTTLAATSADADVSGKDRTFFLNLASFESSDEYLGVMLRTRQWDRIGYVSDPAFFWDWETTEDFARYRELRDDAESLRRRRSILIASLVANRVVSGILSARRVGKVNDAARLTVEFAPPPRGSTVPVARLCVTF